MKMLAYNRLYEVQQAEKREQERLRKLEEGEDSDETSEFQSYSKMLARKLLELKAQLI